MPFLISSRLPDLGEWDSGFPDASGNFSGRRGRFTAQSLAMRLKAPTNTAVPGADFTTDAHAHADD